MPVFGGAAAAKGSVNSQGAALKQTSGPALEPVTLTEIKKHLRVDILDDDDLIGWRIQQAREHAETFTNRQFINATYTLKLDSLPGGTIVLPRPPLSSVTSITYLDVDGASQTLAATLYDVDTDTEPGLVTRGFNDTWPLTQDIHHAVTVTFVAGYGAATTNVPEAIRGAIMLLVGHWYDNRNAVVISIGGNVVQVPVGYKDLLWGYRIEETG